MSNFSKNIDWEKLFNPRGIAIIGASYNPTGGGFFARVMEGRTRKPVYLFNPKLAGKELFGFKVYSSILEIPEDNPIDYAIIGVKAELCPKVLEECGQKGVAFATIFASGFSEVGREHLEKEVLDIAKKYNLRIIGPNCIGVYNPSAGLYFAMEQSKKAGNFGGVFQSGGLAVNVSQLAVSYGCYVSKMISIGNAIDLSHPDFLDYFNQDDQTAIIGLYLENLRSIEKGRHFFEAAKRCNLNHKPVILWKAGKGEATKKAIISHTGGLAGNERIWEAVAKQTGCCMVDNSYEMAALASAFKLVSLPMSRNIGLIGIGGGSTIEASDALEKYNIKIPKLSDKTIRKLSRFLPDVNTNVSNPIDMGGEGALPNVYYRVIIALDKDPNIDAILFIKDPERFAGLQERIFKSIGGAFAKLDINREFIRFISKAKRTIKKPLLCVMLKISEGFQQYKSRYNFKLKLLNRNVPVFESVELAAKVLDRLNTYREFLQKHEVYPLKKENNNN
ncbi:MAG: CoA-binding protein [Promethearchaeota archaeon]